MSWVTIPELTPAELAAFASPKSSLALSGELINESKTNFMRKVKVGDKFYYVKRYFIPGKHLRKYFSLSRVAREWRNAAWFQSHGIPTPRCVAYGEGNRFSGGYWGIIVSEEVVNVVDLRKIFRDNRAQFDDLNWKRAVTLRLSAVVREMHALGFIHNDLQWRNLLVGLGESPEVYIIDCPAGRKIVLKGNRRGVVRDLALLDKAGQKVLSRSERLRFYLSYREIDRLKRRDKNEVRRILQFFEGRPNREL